MNEDVKNTIAISDDEIKVTISPKRDLLVSLINVLSIFALSYSCGLLYELDARAFNTSYMSIIFVPIGFFFAIGISNQFRKRSIVFDEKYIIIYGGLIRVFRMSEISHLTIQTHQKVNIGRRIRGFWTGNLGGRMSFRHANKSHYFGYGLSVEEANYLLSSLQQKGWIDASKCEAFIEKKGEKIKTYLPIIIVCICICLAPLLLHFVSYPTNIIILLLAAILLFITLILIVIINKQKKKKRYEVIRNK
jgi:hypothetical protein